MKRFCASKRSAVQRGVMAKVWPHLRPSHCAALGQSRAGALGARAASVSSPPVAVVAAASGVTTQRQHRDVPAGTARDQRVRRVAPDHILCHGRSGTTNW